MASIACTRIGALAALMLSACTPPTARPVLYGNNDDLDACGAWGEARPGGEGRLEVRAAPDSRAGVIYTISAGEGFWLCDGSDDGDWTGIVVEALADGVPQRDAPCAAAALVSPRQPYRGPCLSGWIPSERELLLAS